MRRKPQVKRLSSKGSPLCPLERDEHNRVIEWAKLMVSTGQEPRLRFLRSGFEGLRLTMGVRMQVKRQSIATGWPDLFLAVPVRRNCADGWLLEHTCGLFIELKRVKGGTVSAEQSRMIGDLNSLGYMAYVCRGADEAINEIKLYLGMR
jgi:hypothetical protein